MNVVHLQQSVTGIKVREELGHFLLIDGDDSSEMFLMSSLFKHVIDTNEVVFLQRETQSNADLIIFNGAVNPLGRKEIKQIKTAISHSKTEKIKLIMISEHDGSIWHQWKSWK